MMDETETLRRIIADCVRVELSQHVSTEAPLDLHRFGDWVASKVLRRLESAGIKAISE